MKSFIPLSLALGAFLGLAATAPPAFAAGQVDFSGYYRIYFSNIWNNNLGSSQDRTNDSAFLSRLNLEFTFHATDEVSVFWRLRGPHRQRWGGDPGGFLSGVDSGNMGVSTHYAYGRVRQDWGTLSIGRLHENFGKNGLYTLGWAPFGHDPAYTAWLPFDVEHAYDGLHWINRWENGFQLAVQFTRYNSARTVVGAPGDEDFNDSFSTEAAYFWEGGGASLGLEYNRNRVRMDHTHQDNPPKPAAFPALKAFYVNPALSHRWANGFALHFEGKAGWGRDDNINSGDPGRKLAGYAFFLDLDYNYGPGNVNLAGWWVSGASIESETWNNLVDMGSFRPLIVAYGANTGPWGRADNAISLANQNAAGHDSVTSAFDRFDDRLPGYRNTSNHWAINLNGRHAFTGDITMLYSVAYLALNKVLPGAKKDIGWEVDLGFNFQLLDNLNLNTTFGYLFTGGAFDGYEDNPNRDQGYKAADAYSWYNSLTFSF